MSAIIPSKRLALFVLVVAALVIATNLLRQQEHIDPLAAFSIATSLALANLALAVAGLRTREWLAWGLYLLISLAVFLFTGFANPLSALVLLAPSLAGGLLALA